MTSTQPLPAPTTPGLGTTHVLLVGGPDDWHGHLHTADTAEPRQDQGTYLITNGVPNTHPDPGARAVYEPDTAAHEHVWFFRGFVPAAPDAAENRRPAETVPAAVALGEHDLPAVLVTDGGEYTIARVLAHWQGATDDQPAIWHVSTTGPEGRLDWELAGYPAHRWSAGTLAPVWHRGVTTP